MTKPGCSRERAAGPRAGICALCWALVVGVAAAPPSQTLMTQAQNFGRRFLGLDKCNACVGTSFCKKFFREEIRFGKWLLPEPNLRPTQKSAYLGSLTDNSDSWRPVVLSRLIPQHLHERSDRSICSSAGRGPTCSIEVVLRATPRFKNWAHSHMLLPEMVKGLAPPMLRCPSQRLLDRIVRRYAEVTDAGSIQMKHFAERDKLRLLYTLAVNQHPLISQMFPGTEGWPFLKYYGACGRMTVWAGSQPIRDLYGSSLETRIDLAYQLLHITQGLASNSLRFSLYYTNVTDDMFATVEDGKLFIADASTIGIIDQQEELPADNEPESDHIDVFSCLGASCRRAPPCRAVRPSQSVFLLCRDILPKLLPLQDVQQGRLPRQMSRLLSTCAEPAETDAGVLQAANALTGLLRSLRPCTQHFSYRYPECRYGDLF